MTAGAPEPLNDPSRTDDPQIDPPRTGDPQIDDTLAQVAQLEELPVADHHDVLAPAHDQLQQALQRDHSRPAGNGR